MNECKVNFLPDGKTVIAEETMTLLQSAEKAGIYINSLCGGQGVCGECRLKITNGKARLEKEITGLLSKEEVRDGYVLACQARAEEDIEVMIPAKSRGEKQRIITDGSLVNYGEPEKVRLYKRPLDPISFFNPLVKKIFLQLPEPTRDDNIADIDRIIRELNKICNYSSFDVSLSCLQGLASKLRENQWAVTATIAGHSGTGHILQIEGGDRSNRNYGLAVDVGTTTVVVQLIDLTTGKVVGVEGSHNRQAGYGADVISRMVFSCGRQGSVDTLNRAVVGNLNKLTHVLMREKGIERNDITAVVAAGNTTMSHFLLGLMPCSIRLDPYVPTATIYPRIKAGEIGIDINPQGILEVMPTVASYVGGDIVAGILACGLADNPEVSCLIDIGTNGEIAIGNNEWIVSCSASAGPAFEGSGSRDGMRATDGAIEKMEIIEGRISYETIGKIRPKGICGSGLVDAVYELARNKIIDNNGKFNLSEETSHLITEDDGPRCILAVSEETETGEPITISEPEIAGLIRAKGAVFSAMKCLIDYVGVAFDQLDTVYVAGGFGSSFNIPKAIGIGLLPDIDTRRIQFVGNSSVMGARMALLSVPGFEKAADIAKTMTNIELSNHPPFMDEFTAALFLPHTDRALFPSVRY